MKILVATTKTQGLRKNDFSFTAPGELVSFGFECDQEGVDGKCGCKRSLFGLASLKGTTTFEIVDDATLSDEKIKSIIAGSLKAGGWLPGEGSVKDFRMRDAAFADWFQLRDIAASWPVGAVIERRGDAFRRRKEVAARSLRRRR